MLDHDGKALLAASIAFVASVASPSDVEDHIENEEAERDRRVALRYNVERRYAKDDSEM